MAEKHTLVFCVRHGTTVLNIRNAFRGNKDVPLDDKGIKDAHELSFYFKPIDICGIVCSDKHRAITTAKIIGDQKDMEFIPTKNLRALDVGDFSGQPRNDENVKALQNYIDNPETTIPGGESLNDFRRRIQPAIQEAIELALEYGEPLMLVSHSSIIHEVGNMLEKDHTATLVEPGGVCAIYISGGDLHAEPIFKPLLSVKKEKADTIT